MDIITQRIRDLREKNKKTQKEVANFLKMTIQAYQKYEYGTREPKIEKIKMLALYYNVTTDYLLGLTDKK